MKRYLCWLAVLAVVAIPDWASACWPLLGAPMHAAPMYYPPPVYSVPIYPPAYVYPPVVGSAVVMPPWGFRPGASAPYAALPEAAKPAQTPAAVKPAATPRPSTPSPKADAIRPTVVKESTGSPNAAAKTTEPTQASDLLTLPKQPSKPATEGLPPLELPKGKGPSKPQTRTNDVEMPQKPSTTAIPTPAPADSQSATPIAPEKKSAPAPVSPAGGTAVPSAAPASDSLIPPPSLPLTPGASSLPSLTLPPEVPVNPALQRNNTSRSSPLTQGTGTEVMMKQFPVARAGSTPLGPGYRTVTFFNHTQQELQLTIEGRSVKLPSKTYLEAKLGPSFTWSYGDKPALKETIPDGAAGLDVVFGG
jgi:hypothetical protein